MSFWALVLRFLRQVYRIKPLRPKTMKVAGLAVMVQDPRLPDKFWKTINRGKYEWDERRILEETLTPQDRVLEFGGGIGFLAMLAAKTCGDGNVVSVEASPVTATVIRDNYKLNGLAPTLLEGAVAPKGGEEVTFYEADSIGPSSLLRQGGRAVAVKTLAAQDLVAKYRPTYLICDIEGAEYDVFTSGFDLSGVNRVLLEVHPDILLPAQINEIIAALAGQGLYLIVTRVNHWCLYFERS